MMSEPSVKAQSFILHTEDMDTEMLRGILHLLLCSPRPNNTQQQPPWCQSEGASTKPWPCQGCNAPCTCACTCHCPNPGTALFFISLEESLLQWVSYCCAWVVTAVRAAQVSPTHWNTFKAFTWWLCPAPAAAHPPSYPAQSRPGPWLLYFAELHRGFQPSIYMVRLEAAKGHWAQNLPHIALKSTGHTAAKSPLQLY